MPSLQLHLKLESIKVSPDNKVYESREECNALIDKKSQVLVGGCKNSFIPEGIEYITAIKKSIYRN